MTCPPSYISRESPQSFRVEATSAHRVWRAPEKLAAQTVAAAAAAEFTLRALRPGTRYWVRARCSNSAGPSEWSRPPLVLDTLPLEAGDRVVLLAPSPWRPRLPPVWRLAVAVEGQYGAEPLAVRLVDFPEVVVRSDLSALRDPATQTAVSEADALAAGLGFSGLAF